MRLHQFGNNVFCGIFYALRLVCGRNSKGVVLVADVEESQENKVNVIEVLEAQEENFHSRVQMGQLREAGKGHEVRTSDQLRQDSERGEEHHSEVHRETDDPDPAEQQE